MVAAPHSSDEAEGHVVGHVNGLLLVFEGHHCHHRAKYLLLAQLGGVVHVGEYGRLDEVAVVEVPTLQLPATEHQVKTCILTELDVVHDCLLLGAGYHGAHVCGLVRWVPNLQGAPQAHHMLQEFVVDAFLYEQARGSPASLACITEHSENGCAGGTREVGIFEHYIRGLAPQFQADALNVVGSLGGDALAGARLASEGNLVHAAAAHQLPTH